jgi:hypothetical protein
LSRLILRKNEEAGLGFASPRGEYQSGRLRFKRIIATTKTDDKFPKKGCHIFDTTRLFEVRGMALEA